MSEGTDIKPAAKGAVRNYSWDGTARGRFQPTGLISDSPPVLMLKERLQAALEEFQESSFVEFNSFWDRVQKATSLAVPLLKPYPYPTPPGPMLSEDQAVAMPNGPGVYFVWEGATISYVGQSGNLAFRCRTRCHHKIGEGDWLSWIEFPLSELYFAESFYIGALRPRLNMGRNKEVSP